MGFFNRLFKKVEDINKGEVVISELDSEFYLESPVEEAKDYWVEMAQLMSLKQSILMAVIKQLLEEILY